MEIFSRGLRNTVGMALHPATGEIWGTDNGGDNLGEDQPPEEINILRAGRDYGWPRCYGDGGRYPGYSGDCAFQTPPELGMQAHSAPLGIGFYTGEQFPARYQNDAFVAFHGSWNRDTPTGYKVVRILASSGRGQGIEDFLTGFLRGTTTSGRPVHAISGPDGALYVSDDMNGVVYRVSYTGPRISPGGLVSAAGAGIRVAAGGLASLYGSGFGDPPEEVRVTINGASTPVFYAGPQQINFLMPTGVEGRERGRPVRRHEVHHPDLVAPLLERRDEIARDLTAGPDDDGTAHGTPPCDAGARILSAEKSSPRRPEEPEAPEEQRRPGDVRVRDFAVTGHPPYFGTFGFFGLHTVLWLPRGLAHRRRQRAAAGREEHGKAESE